jgi:hypothetical protein
MSPRFTALVGSPRPDSTSKHFAAHLGSVFADQGWEFQCFTARTALRDPAVFDALQSSLQGSRALGLVFPLYVDSLPCEFLEVLERLAAEGPAPGPGTSLFAVAQCGFAEARHNAIALERCRLFARQLGYTWRGGLAVGGGGMYGGQPLKTQGGRARFLVRALDLSAQAVAADADLPAEAVALAQKKVIPDWLYFLFANFSMLWESARHGKLFHILARPYVRVEPRSGVKN